MKIGILIDRLNVGGVEKIAIKQVEALRSIGENASLVVLRRKGVVENPFPDMTKNLPTIFLDDRLFSIFRFSFQFPIFHFFSFFHISYPFLIPFIIKKNEFDYLIVHGTYTAFTAIAIKKMRRIHFSPFIWDPIIYILNRVYSRNFPNWILRLLSFLAKALDKFIISNSDELLVGGPAHDSYFRNLSPKIKITTIPPSVDLPKQMASNKNNYILMVTAWKRGKNPEYIFDLLKNLPYIKITLVGRWLDQNYKRQFEKEIIRKGYQKNIKVIGAVSENELNKYYMNALFLLQTNDDRGFGMPALEAAACGTTFIIPKGQGVCALFKEHEDGFFTKEKDTKTVVKYIDLLIKNKELAIKIGKHAFSTVKNKYSWQKHALALKKFIGNNTK